MIKILSVFLLISLVLSIGYVYFEPEIVAAADDTKEIDVTLEVNPEISLTSPGNIAMSTALTMTQNTATGTGASWNVKTINQAGYKLEFKGDHSNIMKDGGTDEVFTDYTEATANTPETWSVTGDYQFGFSAFGTDAPTATWGTDDDCTGASAHIPSTTLKYQGFKGVTAIEVATRDSQTDPDGVNTVLCVAAEQQGVYAPSGSYTADITGTATAL